MAVRNPAWQRDELILALDLYFRHYPLHISASHEEVIKLSEILNMLPIHTERPDLKRFRNPNGVYMKLCNFLRYDPNYHGKGLERGGKLEKEIWNEFSNDLLYLHRVANGIIESINISSVNDNNVDEEENEFPEGKVLYRQHRYRERNRKLVAKVKEIAIKNGELRCQVCGFDFYQTYGELGKGYIECHHTIPVSEYVENTLTRVKDIALVCSNCHRMLHRKRPWLDIDELLELLRK